MLYIWMAVDISSFPIIVRKVFVSEDGKHGNPVGLVVDQNRLLTRDERQKLAKQSGYSEVVFINSLAQPDISIYSPQNEIPFAGHAVIGAAKYVAELNGVNPQSLLCQGNTILCRILGNRVWVEADLSTLPPWKLQQMSSVAKIESLTPQKAKSKKHTVVWAWINELEGIVRARTFASDWDIPEDEANGSGIIKLTKVLNKELIAIHGKGSIILTKMKVLNRIELGGIVSPPQ